MPKRDPYTKRTIDLYYSVSLIIKARKSLSANIDGLGLILWKKVLPRENYIDSDKTKILHRIRLRKNEPNAVSQDIRPQGNLQPDDEIIIPQDDFYVITWGTNFGVFPNSKISVPHSSILPSPLRLGFYR